MKVSDYANGHSVQFVFENGYNLSIVKHDFSYSGENTSEVAVLFNEQFVTRDFVQGIQDDVVGYVKDDELAELMIKVKNWK